MRLIALVVLLLKPILSVHSVENSLKLVHVVFRHGSRSPELKDTYPLDIYGEKDFQPMGWGQLTNAGKQRAYKLGRNLRDRYDSFLGDIYKPAMVSTISTDFDRTKMTALLVLAGLFPPAPSQQWHSDLSWLPIPYNMDRADTDYFIRRPTAYCPAYNEELQRVQQSDTVVEKLRENRQVLDYVTMHAGKPIETLLDVFRIYQTLNAEENMNMTLPEWTQSVYPDRIHALAGWQCYFENYNDILKRLNGGRMLGKVIKNMEASMRNATPERKIYLYSGHENNVVNILAALNLFEPHVPKYSAAVILELHYFQNGGYKVKILYARDVDNEPEIQRLESCTDDHADDDEGDDFCAFAKFLEITSNHVPVNYTAECRSPIDLG